MLCKCNLLCIICSRTTQPGRRRGKGNVYVSDLGLLWQNMVGSKLEKLYNGEVKHYRHCLAKMHATHQAWTAPWAPHHHPPPSLPAGYDRKWRASELHHRIWQECQFTGNYICSSLSHIYHLNVTVEYLELLCVV